MSDYIMNRESLKRHCEAMCERFKDVPTSGTYSEHRLVLDLLKQTEWIPVSERLPEKNTACLVAVGKFNLTQIAMYSDLMKIIDHRIFYQGDVGHDNFEDITEYVKAWMPLPEQYKVESEVEDNG